MGLGNRFVWAVTFISTFSLLVAYMPSIFVYTGSQYETPIYSDEWRAAQLFFGTGNTTSIPHDNDTLTYNTYDVEFYITEGDIYIWGNWQAKIVFPAAEDYIYFYHWWYWYFGPFQLIDQHAIFFYEYDSNLIYKTQVVAKETANMSQHHAYCLENEYLIIFSFNETLYDSPSQAWYNDELYLLWGMNFDQQRTGYSAWDLIAMTLFFNFPNVHWILNAIIKIPLWIGIAYIAYILILRTIGAIFGGGA